jgi:hypothetical protein
LYLINQYKSTGPAGNKEITIIGICAECWHYMWPYKGQCWLYVSPSLTL